MVRRIPWLAAAIAVLGPMVVTGIASCSKVSTAAVQGDRPTRSFVLHAEDTHFVMDGEKDPALTVEKGDRVELTFENTQHGVVHAIAVPPFTRGAREVKWGDRATVTFVASQTGTFEYTCPQHEPFMKGTFIVRPRDSAPQN